MRSWIDEETGTKWCEPDCVDEYLFSIWAHGHDYDGANTVEDLRLLVKQLVYWGQKARDCLWDGKLFGIHGKPAEEDEE